jgi:hypothetical protein
MKNCNNISLSWHFVNCGWRRSWPLLCYILRARKCWNGGGGETYSRSKNSDHCGVHRRSSISLGPFKQPCSQFCQLYSASSWHTQQSLGQQTDRLKYTYVRFRQIMVQPCCLIRREKFSRRLRERDT